MRQEEAHIRAWEDRPRLSPEQEARFFASIEKADGFFRDVASMQGATEQILRPLEENSIPYAILGTMGLNAYGYAPMTIDLDLLLNAEGSEAFKTVHPEPVDHGVPIHISLAGKYPGDGRPKPVAYPDPASAAVRGEKVALLPLPRLIELMLASGMTASHRLKDLADVLEVIRTMNLPSGFADELHPYVQDKYRELWQAAQIQDPE
jgi:hypothetical protein